MTEPLNPIVNHPPHYTQGRIECIEVIQAALTSTEFLGYCKGNALKYIWRENAKGGVIDLEKAIWYLQRAVKQLRKLKQTGEKQCLLQRN